MSDRPRFGGFRFLLGAVFFVFGWCVCFGFVWFVGFFIFSFFCDLVGNFFPNFRNEYREASKWSPVQLWPTAFVLSWPNSKSRLHSTIIVWSAANMPDAQSGQLGQCRLATDFLLASWQYSASFQRHWWRHCTGQEKFQREILASCTLQCHLRRQMEARESEPLSHWLWWSDNLTVGHWDQIESAEHELCTSGLNQINLLFRFQCFRQQWPWWAD